MRQSWSIQNVPQFLKYRFCILVQAEARQDGCEPEPGDVEEAQVGPVLRHQEPVSDVGLKKALLSIVAGPVPDHMNFYQ